MEQRRGSARPRHNMAMEDPDLWVLEFGLFHELDQVAAQIKEKRNLTRAQIEASPLFRRMKLNSLSGTLANERKYPEWDKWLTVFANCCPDDWDSGPDSPHHALLNEYKAQLVLQPLLGESPDINAFLARRKTYLPFTSSATPGEAALAKEMADLAQLLKARSAKPADIRRAIDAAVADHPIDKFKRSILAFITRVKHCSPRPFLYQVYDDIATGRYVPSTKSKPFTEKELREVYGDDKGWKAIVNQTDPDVEEFAGRGQRASSSRTGGGALVRADAETEDQQKKAKAKATTETREGAKAKTTAPAQTAKGKRKQRDEDEDDEEKEAEEGEEEEEEEEKPKAKGKEAKKSEASSKRALSSVRDLRAKSKVLREQAKKHDPLPGLLARKQTTAAPEPVFEGRDNYGDEAEAEAYDSADEGEKAKQTSASSKRQYIERHPSATRLNWDSEDESPLKTRDKQEVIRAARATVRRRKITSESESDNEREAEDDDDEGKKKRATKKVKRDPYEFKVPGERARLAGGRRKKRFWTDDEIELLLEGVRTHGLGCWAKILSEYEFAPGRTSVDLKDKYRNLLKLQAKEQEAHRAKRAALASTDAKARGRQQPPPSKKSKKGDDEEEEEKERSEEEDDSTTTVGSQGRREEAEEEENAADRRNQKERSEKEKEKEKEREEDEEEAEEEREEVEDKKSKKAAAVAQSPRVGSSSRTTQTAAVAQSPRVGGSTTQAVAQSPRVLGSTSSTSTSTQAAAAQRKQQLAAKRREDEDYDENELIIDDDEGQEAEDDEVVAKVKEREESESEREKREQEQKKKKTPAAAAAGQRRIAKRRQAGRAQSIAAPLLAASQEADDDRPSSSAPAVLSASARARRASVAAPRRSDELDYSD